MSVFAGKPLKVVLILGSTRAGPRLGERVAKFVKTEIEKDGHSVQMIDARDNPLPMLQVGLHWLPPAALSAEQAALKSTMDSADAFVPVSVR